MKKSLKMMLFALLCILTLLTCLSAAPSAAAAPARVQDFSFYRAGANSIQLRWTPVKGAEGYVLYQRIGNTSSYQRIIKSRTSGAYTVTGLTPDTDYTFAIRAYRTENKKEVLSPSYPVVDAATAAASVTGLTCEAEEDAVHLDWNPSDGAAGYYVYCDSGSGWSCLAVSEEPTYTGELTGDSEKYSFGVKTYSYFDGTKYISTDISVVNYYTVDPPEEVEGLTFVRSGSDSIQLRWTPSDDVDGYSIYQKTAGAGSFTLIAKGAPDGEYTADELKPDTKYQYAVRSYRMVGGDDVLCPTYPGHHGADDAR